MLRPDIKAKIDSVFACMNQHMNADYDGPYYINAYFSIEEIGQKQYVLALEYAQSLITDKMEGLLQIADHGMAFGLVMMES